MGEYLLFLFWFCRSNTAQLQLHYIHCIHYSNQDTNFKRIFTDHFSAGLAKCHYLPYMQMAVFGKNNQQHKTPSYLCLYDLHYAVRSTSTLKQTCKNKKKNLLFSCHCFLLVSYTIRQDRQSREVRNPQP